MNDSLPTRKRSNFAVETLAVIGAALVSLGAVSGRALIAFLRANWRPVAAIVALVITAAALWSLATALRRGMPESSKKMFWSVGLVTAEETAKLLGDRGLIVIIVRDPGAQPSPVQEQLLTGFRDTLQHKPALSVVATERIRPGETSWPAATLFQILRQYPTADAVVSFVGPPVVEQRDLPKLRARRAKLVVVGGVLEFNRRLFEQKVVDLAITERLQPPTSHPGEPRTARDWFDRTFQVLTPATASSLPF